MNDDNNKFIESADRMLSHYARLADIAQDEVAVAAKRSRHVWTEYLQGRATADDAEAAICKVKAARSAAHAASELADDAAIVLLREMDAKVKQ